MPGDGPSATRRSRTASRQGRVYVECGVTVAVTDSPPQFIRYLVGAERLAPSTSASAIKETEERLYAELEAIVDKRVRKLQRLVLRAQASSSTATGRRSRKGG